MPRSTKRTATDTPDKPPSKVPNTTPQDKAKVVPPPQDTFTKLPLLVSVRAVEIKGGGVLNFVDLHTARPGDEGWPQTRPFASSLLPKIFPFWSKIPKEHPLDYLDVKCSFHNLANGSKVINLTAAAKKIFTKHHSLAAWVNKVPHHIYNNLTSHIHCLGE